MRRKPNELPQLKPMDSPDKDIRSVRQKGLVPHQNRLSVQDVRDYTTPQGAAMANEEMRRLRIGINEALEVAKQGGAPDDAGKGITPKKPTKPDGDGTGDGGGWALTVKHNDIIVGVPKQIQGLNFKNPQVFSDNLYPIIFRLKALALEKELLEGLKDGTDKQVEIRGSVDLGIKSGIIYINRLPSTIEQTPRQIDLWRRTGRNYTPLFGKYGWYVYNYIDHGWDLSDPNDYIINIVDLHKVFLRDGLSELELQIVLDYVELNAPEGEAEEQRRYIEEYFTEVYPATKSFEVQQFIPEIEGMTIVEEVDGVDREKDIIIIRGIYKPDLAKYWGGVLPAQTADTVEEGIIRTNICYYYVLMRKQ